jgi:hypothetical protein
MKSTEISPNAMPPNEKPAAFDYVWFWNPNPMRPIRRKGQRCRVLVWAPAKNSVLVEFEDGFKVITSRNAVRKPKDSVDKTGRKAI